ncbi:MAG TPA: efflux RND transporter periplasmic adaptor subunit [bacterium]|nr:efflux RND transporter periplasmic adaptor subunit [bacterium]
MRRKTWWMAAGIILIAAVAATALVRSREAQTAQRLQLTGAQVSGGTQILAPTVAVGRLVPTQIPLTLALTASVISLRGTAVVSKVAGYLETVAVRPGDLVLTDQVVAVVEHSQLDSQVLSAIAARRRADADLLNARAAVSRAKAQLAVAQANFTRVSGLFQDGLISRQAVDNATGDLQTARANLDAAEAQVGAAQAAIDGADAALQGAKLAQASATIRAPWPGIVVSRTLDPGAYVTPGSGTPILSIADLDHVAVLVNVTEADMSALRRGMPAEVGVDAFPGRTFRGTLTRIAGGVDPDTRTVQVEIDLENGDHALRPGMYARARLTGALRRAYAVPLSALSTGGNQQFVWVVADGKASRRAVTIGATTAAMVEITAGVSPDEVVVFRGTELVREGGAVRTAPASR